ncbi:MAG: hypothetical protein HKN23_18900 [Verrucomicrobiales bacterium]|nr:hypothetical protein [Verrucomicrobiales bacterium]
MRMFWKQADLEISSFEDWEKIAREKKAKDWVDGRSMKECAHSWFRGGGPDLPAEIRNLLNSNSLTDGLDVETVWIEREIRFDEYRGGKCNADAALVGTGSSGRRIAVLIEAKTDEPYGATIEQSLDSAEKKKEENPASRKLERVNELCEGLCGKPPTYSEISPLRYQLFTATAGAIALAETENGTAAVVISHTFVPKSPTPKTEGKNERNRRDFCDFVCRIAQRNVEKEELDDGLIKIAPSVLPPKLEKTGIDLLLGKTEVEKHAAD